MSYNQAPKLRGRFPSKHPHKQKFPYKQLPKPASFRVFDLSPGEQGQEIMVSLRTVTWEDPPDYEAISYAWGATKRTVPIRCDDTLLWVTKNLRYALLKLRHLDRPRTLWADAIWYVAFIFVNRGVLMIETIRPALDILHIRRWCRSMS
jgi:hypothetical protein